MHSTDAQALVWGFNSFIAFASSKSSGRVGWSTGSDEKAVVKEAVKGCRQYGKGCKLQLLFHTANGNIVNNSPNAAPIEY